MNDPFAEQEQPVPPMEDDDAMQGEKNACVIIVLVFIALVLAGVGIWYFLTHRFKSQPVKETATKTEEKKVETPAGETAVLKKNTNLISAENGGTATYRDRDGGTVVVAIPAGALSQDTLIEISQVAEGRVTNRYHFKPDGLAFLKPVTITIPYKESGLRTNETPEDIKLSYWFFGKSNKEMLQYSVDKEAHTLSADVNEF